MKVYFLDPSWDVHMISAYSYTADYAYNAYAMDESTDYLKYIYINNGVISNTSKLILLSSIKA